MAFGSGTVWEVRTTGNDANGGGFDPGVSAPGTDFSQQDAAQTAYTDLVIDAATNTKVTSAAHPFDSTSPGNILNITSGAGFTVQRVEILSVSGNVATCDKSLGTLGSTGGTGNLGGALGSPALAFGLIVSQNTIYIKAGTYNCASSPVNGAGGRMNFTVGGSPTTNVIGYNTTRTLTNNDTTLPTLQPSNDSMIIMDNFNGGNFIYVRNIIFNNNGHSNCRGLKNENSIMIIENCQAIGAFLEGIGNSFSSSTVINCYASGCANGFTAQENDTVFIGCVATACTTAGFSDAGSTGGRYYNCISYKNSGHGFFSSVVGSYYFNCTSYGNTLANGNGFSVHDRALVVNCIATGNSQWGFTSNKGSQTNFGRLINCAGFNNTAGNVNSSMFYSSINFLALAADPFTNAAGGNFLPTAAAAAILNAGYPSSYPQISTNNYSDIGASQANTAGGGGTTIITLHKMGSTKTGYIG